MAPDFILSISDKMPGGESTVHNYTRHILIKYSNPLYERRAEIEFIQSSNLNPMCLGLSQIQLLSKFLTSSYVSVQSTISSIALSASKIYLPSAKAFWFA